MRVGPAQPKNGKIRKNGNWDNFGLTYRNRVEPAQQKSEEKKRVEKA